MQPRTCTASKYLFLREGSLIEYARAQTTFSIIAYSKSLVQFRGGTI